MHTKKIIPLSQISDYVGKYIGFDYIGDGKERFSPDFLKDCKKLIFNLKEIEIKKERMLIRLYLLNKRSTNGIGYWTCSFFYDREYYLIPWDASHRIITL